MPTWTSGTDFDNERDIASMVHDGSEDHAGTGTITSGYNYTDVSSLYGTLYVSNLVGWWPLNEDSGDARDLSGNGNDGTVNGATQGVAGVGALQAYSFDGSDDLVDLPANMISSGTDLTVCFWARPGTSNSGTIQSTLIEFRNNRRFSIRHDAEANGDEAIDMWVDGTWHYSLGSWYVEEWQHLTVTYDSSATEWTVYQDGAEIASFVDADGSGNDNNLFGADIGENNFWEGEMTDVRLYNRVLTSSEIQTLYEWGSGDYANPADSNDGGVSYYDFNGGTAADQWGSNDGTVNGATHVADGGPRGDGAYSFDGSNDYIDTGIQTLPLPITMAAWVKLDSVSNNQQILSNYNESSDDFQLRVLDQSNFAFSVNATATAEGGTTIVSGAWYFVVGTVSDSTTKLYLNGIEDGSASSGSTTDQDSGATINIGVNGNTGHDGWLDGQIDDVRIYDRVLEPWEIQELYQYGTLGRSLLEHTVNV